MRKNLLFILMIVVCLGTMACNDGNFKDAMEGKKTEKKSDKDTKDAEESEDSDNTDDAESTNESRPSATSLAKKWCDLNGKVFNADTEDEKDKAMKALKKYEKQLEDKYSDDKAFYKKIEKAVEACEDESEGRD